MCNFFSIYFLGCIYFCFIFQYSSDYKNFDIIPIDKSDKEINVLKEELNKSKETIELLKNKNEKLEKELKSEKEINLNKIQSLQNIINKKDEELNKLQKTFEQLKSKNEELQNIIKTNEINLNKIQSLQNIINKKDEELYELKDKLKNKTADDKIQDNPNKFNDGGFKCVNIISSDQKIFYAIPCSGNSIFAEIEEILYKEYPEYRETNNTFLANGKEILRFKSINDNQIGTGKPIMLVAPS